MIGAAIAGEPYKLDDREGEIAEKCQGKQGQWICLNHHERFQNNFSKDSHIDDGAVHVLAWNCFEHGPEVP